ncbi:MAG: uracil-DNA glycosylase [Candidatus Pacebacteria bacterium]|nr:uracil-DNA glycosylase [Candidatus Paceibacterota bacterium]MBT3511840.1 uracil-DNA glycosylase [Candidatus Paceibacterota bacterium]MBT4005056.1 uracil-DNA glycosylase [Candidatus Paceibacterota bacterium]MBT4359297.1 uracil-DNA glycosylase [Candidatus Paceibacterota bacterium]MBT4680868.1 uracil-DNA glycosylase [Candidatus Paceibacterota bacterium]
MSQVNIHPSWNNVLKDEFEKSYFTELTSFVRDEYKKGEVYPPGSQIFAAFDHCAYDDVKVVILGQDPYHGLKQANGLCFSVSKEVRIPPSLQNIYKELQTDLGKEIPTHGDLQHWAEQGVLMLNATLTVRKGQAASHQGKGWEEFTDSVIKLLSEEKTGLVFLLWGNYAKRKGEVIDREKHLVLEAAHPSPLSAYNGFFGCHHFSQANQYLLLQGEEEIKW